MNSLTTPLRLTKRKVNIHEPPNGPQVQRTPALDDTASFRQAGLHSFIAIFTFDLTYKHFTSLIQEVWKLAEDIYDNKNKEVQQKSKLQHYSSFAHHYHIIVIFT